MLKISIVVKYQKIKMAYGLFLGREMSIFKYKLAYEI